MRTPTTSFVEYAKDSFARTLEEAIQNLSLPLFKGGSRRFGYGREQSDTDYFVLVEDEAVLEELFRGLHELGFSTKEGDYTMQEGLEQVFCLDKLLHVGIFRKKNFYEQAEAEHGWIDHLLKKKPDLQIVAHELRLIGVNGTSVYHLLLRLAKSPSMHDVE